MFNGCYSIFNNSASVDYSYTVDNLNVIKDSVDTNIVSVIVLPAYNYYDFYFDNCIRLKNLYPTCDGVFSINCDAYICRSSIKYIDGLRSICVKIILNQYIYYNNHYKGPQCYSTSRYLDYTIPTDLDYIDYIGVKATYVNNSYQCNNQLNLTTLITFKVL